MACAQIVIGCREILSTFEIAQFIDDGNNGVYAF